MHLGRIFLYCFRACVVLATLPPDDFVPESTAMSSSSTESYDQADTIGHSTYMASTCTRRDTLTFTPVVTMNTLGACGVPGNSVGHTYTCTSQEACVYDASWWGCCDSYNAGCPTFTACVAHDQPCDAACKTNMSVLKCTDTSSPYCVTTTAIQNAVSSPPASPESSGVCVDVITASASKTVLVSYTPFPGPNPTHVACGATRVVPYFIISASTTGDVEGSLPIGEEPDDLVDPHYTEPTGQGFASVGDFQDSILGNLAPMPDASTITDSPSRRVDGNTESDSTMSFQTDQSAAPATASTPQPITNSIGSRSLHQIRSLTTGAWAFVFFQMYLS